jgi:rhomboid family GlyGly-CTERM serine protease
MGLIGRSIDIALVRMLRLSDHSLPANLGWILYGALVKSMTLRRPPWHRHALAYKVGDVTVQRAYWGGLAVIATVSVMAELADWTRVLRFERGLMVAEPWRLLTAHLVHLGWTHLLLNLLALCLLSAIFAQRIRPMQWIRWWLVSSMAVSGGLYGIDSGLAVYVGASGVLHGLAAAAAVYQLRHGGLEAGWLLGGLVLKLGWEQYRGPTPGVAAWVGGPVVVNAHLYGALGGSYGAYLSIVRHVCRGCLVGRADDPVEAWTPALASR